MAWTRTEVAVPRYLKPLLDEVEDRSRYPVILVDDNRILYDSELRLAGPERPRHEIGVMPRMGEHYVHFLASGLLKLLRLYQAPPAERMVPAHRTDLDLPAEDRRELAERLDGLSPADLGRFSRFLALGMVRQLTSMPVDLRVERELAETLPEHRELQRRYLQAQLVDLIPHFAPEIGTLTPPRLYAASTAMNLVLADEAADLAAVDVPPPFKGNGHRELGDRLRRRLREVQDPGLAGDRQATDGWAAELGMARWYEWMPLGEARG